MLFQIEFQVIKKISTPLIYLESIAMVISDSSIIPQNYLGIGSAKAEDDQHLEFTTLEMAMQKNGDHGKKITYLKLDIEQSEVEVLRELIDSA